MKHIYKFLLSVILLCGSLVAQSQNRVVTGTVRDASGVIPGATVLEKGVPGNGVSTSVEGKFSITLRGQSNVLIIRGVSYASQEVNVSGKRNINVTLAADAKGLEEVVVVGYGTQKKINVTGAVSSVNRDEIQRTPSASIQNALSGKLPGFFSQQRGGRPGDDGAQFFIRGVSTPGNQQPLILVDDVIYNYSDFANLDPNEVASISILKDAATTAPYGIEGANGVILVTTRRGQVGAPRINLRSEFGKQVPTFRPQFLDAYNSAILTNEAFRNDATIAGTLASFTPPYSAADLQKFQDGSDPYGHPNVDWYHTLIAPSAPISKSNFDISGGTQNVQYMVSVGYESQGGLLKNFSAIDDINNDYQFDRFNFRSNLDIKANKNLSFKADFSGYNAVTNSPKFAGSSGSAETAIFFELYNYESLRAGGYPIYNPNGSFGSNSSLPANIIGALTYGGYQRVRQNLLNMNVSANEKLDFITDGLSAKIMLSASNQQGATRTLSRTNFPSYTYDVGTGAYTPRNSAISRVDPFALSYASGRPRRQTTIQANLNYAHSFNKNNISGLLLYNQSTAVKAHFTGDGEEDDSYIPSNIRGLTARATYNYNNKYLLEFDGSYNGTDRFAAKKRYGFFPAGSIGWNIAEESFVKDNLKFLNNFKIRASYGIVGNDNLLINGTESKNTYEDSYDRGADYSFGETNNVYSTIVPGSLPNESVTWEKERKLDIGLDFSMFNGKITGTVDYFKNRRYDILSRLNTVPHYYGVVAALLPPENLGVISNQGYEFELNYNGKIGKDFGFNLKGTYSYAKNKIIEIDEVPPLYPWQRRTGQSLDTNPEWIWDGYYSVAEAADPSVPKYVGSTVAGVTGTTLPGFLKYRDLNGDGVVSDLDKAYVGKANLPTTNIGFATGFTYKRFSMNILLQAALNFDLQVNYNFATPFKGNLQEIHMNRWSADNPSAAQFPTLVSNFHGTYMTSGNFSTFWSIPGDYLRIKSLDFGYQLPEKWAKAVGMKGIRVYANGYNLYTWSRVFKKYGLDPEIVRESGGAGADGKYPQTAIYNIGVNVSIK